MEVLCITRSDKQQIYDRIISLDAKSEDGSIQRFSQQEAIELMEKGTHEFYYIKFSFKIFITVATSSAGKKYLRLNAVFGMPNTLLELPDCV